MPCRSQLTVEEMERMAQVLRLLAHAQRLRLIEQLESGPAPVHDLVKALDLPQATVSQHLNQMRRVGLVGAERRHKEVWYRIADPRALTILDCIRKKKGGAR